MLETVDVGTQDLDLYELISEKAQMAKPKRVRRTSLLGNRVNKSHKKRKGSAPNQVATALSRARSKTRTASLTATPAYPLRLPLGTRGWVNEDGTFGRVHHLCGDAPQSHPSDHPEIPAAHGQ
jgi:hypothetical protein